MEHALGEAEEIGRGVLGRPHVVHSAVGCEGERLALVGMVDEEAHLAEEVLRRVAVVDEAVLAIADEEGHGADGMRRHHGTAVGHRLVQYSTPALVAVGGEAEDVMLAHEGVDLFVGEVAQQADMAFKTLLCHLSLGLLEELATAHHIDDEVVVASAA